MSERPLHGLPPEELERLVREHLDAMWGESLAAGSELRDRYHPVKVASRHPFLTAAVAGAAVALIVRRFRRRAAPAPSPCPPESLGRSFARSLLSNLASSAAHALPALAAAWAARSAAATRTPGD